MKKNAVMGLGIAAGLLGMSIVAPAAFAEPLEKDCNGVQRLVCASEAAETYRVTNPTDSVAAPEEGTLRWAVEQANANPGMADVVIDAGLNIQLEEPIEINDGLILRGEGDADSRATIGAADVAPFDLIEIYEALEVISLVQVENLSFDGLGLEGSGIKVSDGLTGFGLYDTSMRNFGDYAVQLEPDGTLDHIVIENSEFAHNGDGSGVVQVSAEDVSSVIKIRDSRFADNTATAINIEGEVWSEGDNTPNLEITGTEFVNNRAPNFKAGAIVLDYVSVWSAGPQEVHLVDPIVRISGNQFVGNSGEYAGAIFLNSIGGDFEDATNDSEYGELVVVDRSTFENNTAEFADYRANDILVDRIDPEMAADTPEACFAGLTPLHILNSTFSSAGLGDPALRILEAECSSTEIDHTTFVGDGIVTGESDANVSAGLFLRNTVFDTAEEQAIVSKHEVTPFAIFEDHVAYTAAPDAELVPEGPGRIVAPSSDLALGDFTTVDAESDGLAYTTSVRVPGIIAGTDPEEASVLTGAGVTVADPRLALDQAGDPRPGAATRAAAQPTIGAVEGTAPKETAPPGPVDPVIPEPVDPKPVDPKPVDPAPVAPKVDPASPVLANTGSAMNATNWFILGGILLLAGVALVGGSRLFKKKDAVEPNSEGESTSGE